MLTPFNVECIGVFGSYARDEAKAGSDLDLLVSFKQPLNLIQLIGIEKDLSEQLGMKVDLVTEHSLHPKLKALILKELNPIPVD